MCKYFRHGSEILVFPASRRSTQGPCGPFFFRRNAMSKLSKAIAVKKPKSRPARRPESKKQSAPVKTVRTMVLFGTDENKRPRAARFVVDENLGLLAAAADSLDLIVCEVKTAKLAELAQKLPVGKVHATGPAFVPYVRQELYDTIVEAAGTDAAAPGELPKADSAPRTFDEIAPGHLVIAQEDLETGWWEAIVLERDADTLTLRYRDYPRLPKFQRARTAVALLNSTAAQ